MTVLRNLSPIDRERTAKELGELLAQRSEVIFGCVHGSFLDSDRRFHDIDVAVWVDHNAVRLGRALAYQWELSSWLERKIPHPVDVKLLNQASIGFRHSASGGLLLTPKTTQQWFDFRERTWMEYLDFAPIARQALLDLLGSPDCHRGRSFG